MSLSMATAFIWKEIAGKLASREKHDKNLQGSWLISKNTTRICKEAELFQKTWHELAGKLSYSKKPDTNLQGSWLISKNMARTCREAGLFQKTRQEFARKLYADGPLASRSIGEMSAVFSPWKRVDGDPIRCARAFFGRTRI